MVKSPVEGQQQQDNCFECPVNFYLLEEGVEVEQARDARPACLDCPGGADCYVSNSIAPCFAKSKLTPTLRFCRGGRGLSRRLDIGATLKWRSGRWRSAAGKPGA